MESLKSLAVGFVDETYISQGLQNHNTWNAQTRNLLTHRKLPAVGWSDQTIEFFIQQLSAMDSNNFMENVGVGEREGRVYSSIVKRRHFYLAHGIGRSGDVSEVQPKAAGSSLIYQLTNILVKHAMEIAGIRVFRKCLVLPLATGMTISLCLQCLRTTKPTAKYVLWPRIDQKSCFKAILCAGLTPIVIENTIVDGAMCTDVAQIKQLLNTLNLSDVLCVLSTTSCFAPRQPDRIDEIAVLCQESGVAHLVNNAYGVQCERICKLINRAVTKGRVDAVIQSTDKNFMVPVGGAIVGSPSEAFVSAVSASYAGRASISPVLDLFLTLLSMGETGLRRLLTQRRELFTYMNQRLEGLCEQYEHRLRLLHSPGNGISIGVSIQRLLLENNNSPGSGIATGKVDTSSTEFQNSKDNKDNKVKEGESESSSLSATYFGSMLFQRCVSGCRVVHAGSTTTSTASSTSSSGSGSSAAGVGNNSKMIGGHNFVGWGAHIAGYPQTYFTTACAIGTEKRDIDLFITRLVKVIKHFSKVKLRPAITSSFSSSSSCLSSSSLIARSKVAADYTTTGDSARADEAATTAAAVAIEAGDFRGEDEAAVDCK